MLKKNASSTANAADRIGPIKTYRVMLFIASWGHMTAKLGRPPVNVEEYADWWGQKSKSQSYRELALFRQVLPEQQNPTQLVLELLDQDPNFFGHVGHSAFRIGAML